MPMNEAAKVGDIFVTTTGNRDVIIEEHFEAMQTASCSRTPVTSTWRSTLERCPPRCRHLRGPQRRPTYEWPTAAA